RASRSRRHHAGRPCGSGGHPDAPRACCRSRPRPAHGRGAGHPCRGGQDPPARHDGHRPDAYPRTGVNPHHMWRQPKAVWAVAFACVIAFMGIGLVDPIPKPIADQLNATPSQVSLLFTSYMAVMGVAMLVTGAVASRIGAKRTLLIGLVVIIAGAALAGWSDTVMGIVGWRALWGLGNALFIATALSTIVSSARGSVAQAVILYEAALGLGIAVGPLVGGLLGGILWGGPFYRGFTLHG